MAKRKRRSASNAGVQDHAEAKRSRTSASVEGVSSRSVTYGRVDPTYGQRSAIPGLDDFEDWDWEGRDGEVGEGGDGGDEDEGEGGGDGEEKDWEEDGEYDGGRVDLEALKYLRSVREEASGIPTLLVAPRVSDADVGEEGVDRGIYDNGVGDSRGWYEDGAYTAAPIEPEDGEDMALNGDNGGERDAQRVYYEALMGRFKALRKQLSQVPPRHAVEKLDADHGCHMSGSSKDYELWRWRIANTDPKPAQLANMDKGTALRILNAVGDPKRGFLSMHKLLGDGAEETRKRVSAWIWGLLAKLPDRGEMVSEEVGVVRELGKRAVWVGVELKGVVDMESLKEHVEDEGEAEDEDGEIVEIDIEEQPLELDLDEDDPGFADEEEGNPRTQRSDSSSPVPQFPSSIPNHEKTPFIGPISPESLRGSKVHGESLTRDDNTNAVKGGGNLQQQVNEDEEEALAQARANLLARLNSHQADTLESTPSNPPTATSEDGEWAAEDDTPNAISNSTAAPLKQLENQQASSQLSHSHPQTHSKLNRNANDNNNNSTINHGAEPIPNHETPNHQHEHQYQHQPTTPTTRATAVKTLLDMIITIAGEVYGQRDLLEFREKWT